MTRHLFQHIIQGQPTHPDLEAEFPFYPLNSPGMPIPGPDFTQAAAAAGDSPPYATEGVGSGKRVTEYGVNLHYLYRRALYDDQFQLGVKVKGSIRTAQFLPGHLLDEDAMECSGGPTACKVMIIGKHPGVDEVADHRNFVGPSSDCLFEALEQLGVHESDRSDWYVTNLVKHMQLDRQSDGLPTAWINNCMPLLHQELRLCRPDYILCLGSHSSKALLGKYAGVQNMVGRVERLTFPITEPGEPVAHHTAKVMTAVHPAAVYRTPELFDGFLAQLGMFAQLSRGVDVGADERDIKHQVVYKRRHLARIVDEIRADPSRWTIAIDGEWHGDYPTEEGAYLRTVQFSSQHKEGVTVVLRHQGGHPAFQPSIESAIEELNRLLKTDASAGYYPRVGGWFLRADMPWLLSVGIDCRAEFATLGDPDRWREGGFAADLEYHAVYESASYKLEDVATRLTTAPRYDRDLHAWREAWCKTHNAKSSDLEGYGDAPDWVLHPYACYDPDVTRRIHVECAKEGGRLERDWNDQPSHLAYWTAHRATLGFLEMEMHGLMLDTPRVDELTQIYKQTHEDLLADFRRQINWPTFNPESSKQCVALLFGDRYAYKVDPQGNRHRVRPDGAISLNLTPIKSTGKRSRMWSDLLSRGEERDYTPSVDKEVLGILGHEHSLAMRLRDIKFVGQVLKQVLRPPEQDGDGQDLVDEEGEKVYSRGLASFKHTDGMIRTHMSQHKETGRAASYRPALQNLSCDRETEFLTRRGWVFGDDLTEDDLLAQYHADTGGISFTRPTALIKQQWKGELVHLRLRRHMDLMVTPNHRCLLRARKQPGGDRRLNTSRQGLFEVNASDFKPDNHHFVAGNYAGGNTSLSPWQVVWLAAVQADGHYHAGGAITFSFTKTRKRERLLECLQELGASWTTHSHGCIYISGRDNSELIAWTKELMPAKEYGPWLLDMCRGTLDAFCNEICFWDGNAERADAYFSNSRASADWVQIILSLSSRRSRMRRYTNSDGNGCWCVDSSTRHVDYVTVDTSTFTKELVPYDDYVYCVTVPSEFIVVRRNGVVAVTGNSKRREDDYKRILGKWVDDNGRRTASGAYTGIFQPRYVQPIRTIFRARPGHVLVEVDYKGAELAVIAWLAGDPVMIDHVSRNNLPESHPDHYDIHSQTAVNAFNLRCAPTKTGLKEAGHAGLRVAAKNVNFGRQLYYSVAFLAV